MGGTVQGPAQGLGPQSLGGRCRGAEFAQGHPEAVQVVLETGFPVLADAGREVAGGDRSFGPFLADAPHVDDLDLGAAVHDVVRLEVAVHLPLPLMEVAEGVEDADAVSEYELVEAHPAEGSGVVDDPDPDLFEVRPFAYSSTRNSPAGSWLP